MWDVYGDSGCVDEGDGKDFEADNHTEVVISLNACTDREFNCQVRMKESLYWEKEMSCSGRKSIFSQDP